MLKTLLKAAFWDSDGRRGILESAVCSQGYFFILSNDSYLRSRQKWSNIITMLRYEADDIYLLFFKVICTLHPV